jgi:transcriptional regulator with XRE-family HTH domain
MTATEIKERRLSLGLTQGGLAEALGVALNTVSRWELGTSRPEGARMLELALTQLEWQKTLDDDQLAKEMRASLRQLEKLHKELKKLVAEADQPASPPAKAKRRTRKHKSGR